MSTTRKYQIQEIVEVQHLKVFTPQELLLAEKQICELQSIKLNKLLALFPSCEAREMQIIDELGIATDFKEVAEVFGFTVAEMASDRGKLYNLSDQASQLLDLLEFDPHLSQLYKALKSGKSFSVTEVEQIRVTTNVTEYDGRETGRKEESRQSLGSSNVIKNYQNALTNFNSAVKNYSIQHNKDIVTGTVVSVEKRASKMGYAVQKKQAGQKIELVLVRMR